MSKKISLLIFFFISFNIFSQTDEAIDKIIKYYDLQNITILQKKLAIKYTIKKKEAEKFALENNIPIKIKNKNNYSELMQIVNGKPIYYTTYNSDAAISTRTNTLHNGGILGLNLEGQNMTAYVWDGGVARGTHQEYDGLGGNDRYSIIDNTNDLNFHAAHVTGTIMASGVQSNAKGMAPQCFVKGSDWNNDLSEITTQTFNGMLISNHSYGYIAGNIPVSWFGAYTDKSRDVDEIMFNAPYYLMVSAAGNDGNDNSTNTNPINGFFGYDKLSGKECSKNALVIANAQDANIDANGNLINVTINSSSSQGPTDDLRIKPDIAGNGTQVYSTLEDSDSSYASFDGTSMATPNVTGSLLLLQQYYNQINGNYMKASTLKGLALHTADDSGIPGPDAIFGWGLLNTKKAAETINGNENKIIEEITLSNNQTYSLTVLSDDINSLKASISWTDLAGTINENLNSTIPALVNDLDIRVTQNTNTYYPYKLTNVNSNAQGDNFVDPYERVDIPNASGYYTITVSHKGNLTNNTQNFSLIVTGIQYSGNCVANEPENLNVNLLLGTANFTWNDVIGATYELRYKETTSSTWTYVTLTNESLEINDLTGSQYNAEVRSICEDEGTQSNWVSFESFPFFVLSNDEFDFTKYLDIYSTNESVEIISKNSSPIQEIRMYSFLGKEIYIDSVNSNDVSISKNNIPNEKVVIVKIKLENGSVINKKLIL